MADGKIRQARKVRSLLILPSSAGKVNSKKIDAAPIQGGTLRRKEFLTWDMRWQRFSGSQEKDYICL
jgi:hypothetical protein